MRGIRSKGDAGIEQALEINLVRVLFQEKNVLAHDESPDSVIDGRVIVITLIDCELQQMFGATGDCRVVIADTILRIHSGRPPRCANVTYDSFLTWARMIPRGRIAIVGRFCERRKPIRRLTQTPLFIGVGVGLALLE